MNENSHEARLRLGVPLKMSRNGDWIQTFTGVEFYPLDPRPEEIRIEDIAHSLSMQCRYTGHTRLFYSVAEHSIRVAELCPPEVRLRALLHDASEAYLVDLPRPIKRASQLGVSYQIVENVLMEIICQRFSVHSGMPEVVERADKAMLWVESKYLMPTHPCWDKWREFTTGDERPIIGTASPQEAERAFLDVFRSVSVTT